MSKTFRPWDIDQRWLLPPSVHDLVPSGHVAHFVRDTVRESLDLSAILAAYGEERGYPPYHPAMMTALLLYGYSRGVYSSRKLAQACEERVDFMAVTAMNRPDFRTIAEFRRRHLAALGGLFVQVLQLCRAAGLVKLGHVALDGTKLAADASKHKAMSYGRMREAEKRLAGEVAGWFARARAADAGEDQAFGADARGDEMPDWVRDKQARLERIRAARAALEAEAAAPAEPPEAGPGADPGAGPGAGNIDSAGPGPSTGMTDHGRPRRGPDGGPPDKAQRNFTDPDSRILKTADGFIQGYNAQAAVDAGAQVIVAHGLGTATTDQAQLAPMLAAIKANTGRLPRALSADAGYCSEANLDHLAEHGVAAYVATGRQKHGRPAAVATRRTPPPASRVAAMAAKLKRAGRRSRYRLRKQVVEPVFGQIKAARSFRKLSLRGLDNARGEWALICTVHNLLKLATATR